MGKNKLKKFKKEKAQNKHSIFFKMPPPPQRGKERKKTR
jgi:hypothetical protein